ncbi:SCAN domain-containing protein 3 [Araneus ventricosus]|uniref:SCAN domain-containing protein 3 n=1 Tax=Araneus ventricosus TaxID=182803 RepID=A0A4Y2F0T5_ARAVE|nr:SCAN domain-containing protein 3 [Araneus ventricosus]
MRYQEFSAFYLGNVHISGFRIIKVQKFVSLISFPYTFPPPSTISQHFNSRCQVDLIDYQIQPDGKFKFLLIYQDHLKKFAVLKPLTSNRSDEVPYNLLDIFLLFGAASILHSDNRRDFCNKILKSVTQSRSEIKMINGKPRHSQSQGSVERANQEIENMLTTWMMKTKLTSGVKAQDFYNS